MTGIALQGTAPGKVQGFSLIELMVVVVMVAILAAIAIPAYQDNVLKGKRSDAKAALSEMASLQEQYFMDNKTYTSTMTDLGYKASGGKFYSEGGYYEISVTSASGTAYALQAVATGKQLDDSKCKTFKLDSLGQESSLDSSDIASDCW